MFFNSPYLIDEKICPGLIQHCGYNISITMSLSDNQIYPWTVGLTIKKAPFTTLIAFENTKKISIFE